jgi:hypothetical protein
MLLILWGFKLFSLIDPLLIVVFLLNFSWSQHPRGSCYGCLERLCHGAECEYLQFVDMGCTVTVAAVTMCASL